MSKHSSHLLRHALRHLGVGCVGIAAVLCSQLGYAESDLGLNHAKQNLVHALHQATRNEQEQSSDLDSLLWLSSMSERLEKTIKNPFYRVRLLSTIQREAEREGLDPQLVLAVIDVESAFNRHALSHAGAQGLMQVMPFWKEVYGQPQDDLYNPIVSLQYGCKILRHYLDRYQDLRDALAAYNGSLGRDTYPDKVLSRMQKRWNYEGDRYSDQDATQLALR